MNPLKSLMACAIMALGHMLAAAPAAASTSTWRTVEVTWSPTEKRTYHVKDQELQAQQLNAQIPIFRRQSVDTVVAGAFLRKEANDAYFLVQGALRKPARVLPRGGGTRSEQPQGTGTGAGRRRTSDTRVSTEPKPDQTGEIDPEAAALVRDHPGLTTQQQKDEAARALTRLKRQSPADFTALKNAPADKRRQAIDTVITGLALNQAADEEIRNAVSDNLAAILGHRAPTGRPSGSGTPSPTAASEEQAAGRRLAADPINTLNILLSSGPARGYAEERFKRYFLRREKPFVDPAYMTSAAAQEAKVEERMAAMITSWIDQMFSQNKKHMVSELLYVLGFDAGLPAWAQPHAEVLDIMADPARHAYPRYLENDMVGWTVKGSTRTVGRITVGPYAGAPVRVDDWALAILQFAAERAHAAYADPRHRRQVRASVEENADDDTTPRAPGSTRRDAGSVTGREFGVNEMYEEGAVVGNIVVGRDGAYRRVSIKAMTRRELPSGRMIDELGICDISDPGSAGTPGNIVCQRFPLRQTGESTFALDDRVQGNLKYKLSMKFVGGKKVVEFGTPDGRSKISTSVEELNERREAQVRNSRVVRRIGDQHFKIIPQGGEFGTLLYYPSDANGRLTGGATTPALMAQVSELGPDGRTARMSPPNTAIGYIGAPKADKSNFYYLVWNEELKLFEPKPCKANDASMPCEFKAPPPPAPTTTAGTGTTAPTTGTRTEGTGTTTPASTTTTTGEGVVTEDPNRVTGEGEGSDPALKNCSLQEEQFSYNLKRVADQNSGFVFFLTKQNGNAFQLCVSGDKSVFFQGVPIWGRAVLEGENLIVESVAPGGQTSMIPADEIEKGQVAGAEFRVPGRPSYTLSGRTMYYVERAKITAGAIAAGGQNTLYADEVAWVSFVLDPRTKEARIMQVRIKDTDVEKAEAAIRKAYTIGNASRSAFADQQSQTAIINHVKAELPKYNGQNKPMLKKPKIEINLFVRRESTTLEPAVVVDIQAAGRQTGTDDKGEPIITAEPYEQLLYCYARSRLETRAAHNQHLRQSTSGGN